MAFGQDALEELSRELRGGYNLNTRLLALLAGEPLDSRRQQAAVAMVQELSGVHRSLMASLFLLSSGGSNGAPRTPLPAKVKRTSSGEELTPAKKVRVDVVKKDITASPEDAYEWRKYGQKIIQYSEFPRVYYRCMYSHGRGCRAKKQVQQQDNSSRRPMYLVTYVNEHTCKQVLPSPSEPTVTGGAPSPWPPLDLPDDTHVDVNMVDEMFALCGSPLPYVQTPAAPSWSSMSPPLPVQVRPTDSELYMLADGGYTTPDPMSIEEILQLFSPDAAQSISQCCRDNMPVAVTPFPDSMSAWPQYC